MYINKPQGHLLLLLEIFFLGIISLAGNNLCYSQELPVTPVRTLSFTTDEGSYMNVDVSPDGKTLIFDLLGDLYTVPSIGGVCSQLTRGVALNIRPVWSPDGKRIAYVSDFSGHFRLSVMDLASRSTLVIGSSNDRLNYGSEIVWTPDGNFIIIGEVVYGVAGGKISAGIHIKSPIRFSSSGQLVYACDSGRLFRYDLLGGTRLAISPILKDFYSSALSPDAHWWCYIGDSNSKRCLFVQDLINNKVRLLVPSLIEDDPRYNPQTPAAHFSFSPDSKCIFIAFGKKIHRINMENESDQVISFIAHVKSELGPYNYHTYRVKQDLLRVGYTRFANASPDGKHLVFSALDKIYIMNIPNGKARVLVAQSIAQFQPAYSPDGKWIAYTSWCDTSGGFLWCVNVAGGNAKQLTYIPGEYQHPVWSPDGKEIAVVRGIAKLGDRDDVGSGTLMIIDVDNGNSRIIDDSVPLLNNPVFSANGHQIIYTPKYRSDTTNSLIAQLVSRDLDGANQQVVAVGAGITYHKQKSISPDGRYIVYSADEDLYLVPICVLTKPVIISDNDQQLSVIRFAAGVNPNWAEGGKILEWSYGNRFYRVNPNKIMAAAEKDKTEDKDFRSVSIPPDEVVNMRVDVPRFYAHGLMALKNVRIITMKNSQVIEHGSIVMQDGRILSVGPVNSVRIPANARVFDLPGTTIMPGLVDLHLHMRIPSDIFPQQSWMFLINLAYGITTARDPSSSFDSFGYTELLESGAMIGPRLYSVGRAVRFNDGVIRMANLNDAMRLVFKRKLFSGSEIKQYELPDRMQREWLSIACRKAGLNMTNEGAYDPILQIAMIKDGSTGVEHNPVWGDVGKDIIEFVARSGTYLTPTLQVAYGTEMGKEYFKHKFWHFPDQKLRHFGYSDSTQTRPSGNGAESIEAIINAHPRDTLYPGFLAPASIDTRILRAGGKVTLGSHGNDEGIGAHNELWALQMGGFTNMEALEAATIAGAKAMGVQKDLGSIEVGKIADLIVLNKNPLNDIHNSREIRYVMKDGVLYDGNTLDEIWPNKKKCPEWKLKNNKDQKN
jgi:Tol biopolymer transport system component